MRLSLCSIMIIVGALRSTSYNSKEVSSLLWHEPSVITHSYCITVLYQSVDAATDDPLIRDILLFNLTKLSRQQRTTRGPTPIMMSTRVVRYRETRTLRVFETIPKATSISMCAVAFQGTAPHHYCLIEKYLNEPSRLAVKGPETSCDWQAFPMKADLYPRAEFLALTSASFPLAFGTRAPSPSLPQGECTPQDTKMIRGALPDMNYYWVWILGMNNAILHCCTFWKITIRPTAIND